MINGEVESISSKTTYLEDKCFVEENSSCKASFLENGRCFNDDILQLDLVRRLSVSSTHFQNGEGNEPSISADDKSLDCQTPTERKFDPFATSPDDFMLAPNHIYTLLQQTLNYDLGTDSEENIETDPTEDSDAEKTFFEQIFNSLLELIISSKLMEISVNTRAADSDQAAECKTPTHLPLLTGIGDTCPPAPTRRTMFVKEFDHSICRKLDFDNSFD